MSGPVVIFLHSGDYDRMHEGLSIAVAAGVAGRQVEIYLTWWALERVLADDLDAPRFGPGRHELERDFEEKGFPTLRQLLQSARESGRVRLHACTGSLAVLGENALRVQGKVDELLGWSAILDRTAGATDRFFL